MIGCVRTRRAVLVGIVGWGAIAVGVGLATLSFVQLVEVRDRAADASPWWWLGLVGAAVMVMGLGLRMPSSASPRGDGDPGSAGS